MAETSFSSQDTYRQMRSSRRRFLATSAAALSYPVVGGAKVTTAEQSDQTTPSSPDSEPVDPVMAEIYGELELPQDDPFWTWDIPYFSEDAIIEYEVRSKDGGHLPDVLVVDDDGLGKYCSVESDDSGRIASL